MTEPTCPTCGIGIRDHEAGECLDMWCCSLVEPEPKEMPKGADPWSIYASPDGFWTTTSDYNTGDVPYWMPMPVSTNWDDAGQVIKKMIETHEMILCYSATPDDQWWSVEFLPFISGAYNEGEIAETASLAICRAAIIAELGGSQ